MHEVGRRRKRRVSGAPDARHCGRLRRMRKAMAFPVRFVAEGQSVQTSSRDLDEDTLFVRCVEPPGPGDRVALRLYLPGISAGGSIEAEVIEASDDGFRARFVELSAEQPRPIRAALAAGPPAGRAPGRAPPAPRPRRPPLPAHSRPV